MAKNIKNIVGQVKRGFHFVISSIDFGSGELTSALGIVRGYESACLEVYDRMCMQDRLATAFALDRYNGAVAALENHPEPGRSELRGLICDRDVVPPSIEVAVDALSRDVRSMPEAVMASAMRARHYKSTQHPASIRRIECALELMAMAATRRSKAKSEPAIARRSAAA